MTMQDIKLNKAEATILGACMLSPDAYEVAQGLTEEHFSNLSHQPIWKTIRELKMKAEPFDVINVAGHLGERQELGIIGGPVYLMDLITLVDHRQNIINEVLMLLDRGAGPSGEAS